MRPAIKSVCSIVCAVKRWLWGGASGDGAASHLFPDVYISVRSPRWPAHVRQFVLACASLRRAACVAHHGQRRFSFRFEGGRCHKNINRPRAQQSHIPLFRSRQYRCGVNNLAGIVGNSVSALQMTQFSNYYYYKDDGAILNRFSRGFTASRT